jgi:hypothetical protein
MKVFITILTLILLINSITNAQYKFNKIKYDYRTYTHQPGDRYDPDLAGFLSGVVPGLGQATSGETGRGFIFFGGSVGSWIILMSAIPDIAPNPGASARRAVFGGIGVLSLWLWSIGDAQRVAKVNSLAWRDKKQSSLKMELQPHISTLNYSCSGKYSVGMTLKFSF